VALGYSSKRLQSHAHLESLRDGFDDLHYAMPRIYLLAESQQSKSLQLVHVFGHGTSVTTQFRRKP
jgi:hypothetical protein